MHNLITLSLAVVALGMAAAARAETVKPAVEGFPLTQVRLLDGPCKTALDANHRYLMELDPDRLLRNFRVNAGLPAPGEPLGGWEDPNCELRGHFVGHYLSGLALMYEATGDKAVKQRADRMVAELAKCQKALGGGYLSAFPESFWDRLESGNRIPWAPYYTIHKIMAGLFDVYELCGNRQALDVLKGMAGYFKRRTDKLSDEQMARIMRTEFGGMSEVLHNLYGVTHDPAHLALAHRFDQPEFLGPLAERRDNLTNIHANTQIPKICGAARRYELTGDPSDRTIVEFFWDRIVNHRSYATGGSNAGEGWGPPDRLAHTLTVNNQECCTTYNMLKVTRYLFRWTADPKYADYYELAFLNGILGTQEPSTGQLMYYVPLATGFTRSFGTPNSAFWCCYGTGVESFSKLADSIYFHDRNALYVNLFIPSEVSWKDKGVRVEQTTRFPDEASTKLTVHTARPARFALRLRVPGWTTSPVLLVNGARAMAELTRGAYATLDRQWKEGDTVELRVPMALHDAAMPDDPEMVAPMIGPVVLAGVLPTAQPLKPRLNSNMTAVRVASSWPRMLTGDPTDPSSWLKPDPSAPNTYRLASSTDDVTFEPFYKVVAQPYGIYWTVARPDSPRWEELRQEQERQRELAARVVDRVTPGNEAEEQAHNLKGQNTSDGQHMGRNWRHAPDGWFSWDLKLSTDRPLALLVTYWGDDVQRAFDVLVDGEKIASQTLDHNKPGAFFDVEYPLPSYLIAGKERITVRFQAHPNNIAGGVFGAAVVKAK